MCYPERHSSYMIKRIHPRANVVEKSFERTAIFKYKCFPLLIWKRITVLHSQTLAQVLRMLATLIIPSLSTSKEIHGHLLQNWFLVSPKCWHYKKYYINISMAVIVIIIIIPSNSTISNSAGDHKQQHLRGIGSPQSVPWVMRWLIPQNRTITSIYFLCVCASQVTLVVSDSVTHGL